jgi:hypothetical protein
LLGQQDPPDLKEQPDPRVQPDLKVQLVQLVPRVHREQPGLRVRQVRRAFKESQAPPVQQALRER